MKGYRCNTCGNFESISTLTLISEILGEQCETNFCSYQCLLQFILEELKKRKGEEND